jgi:hypothetical protein
MKQVNFQHQYNRTCLSVSTDLVICALSAFKSSRNVFIATDIRGVIGGPTGNKAPVVDLTAVFAGISASSLKLLHEQGFAIITALAACLI